MDLCWAENFWPQTTTQIFSPSINNEVFLPQSTTKDTKNGTMFTTVHPNHHVCWFFSITFFWNITSLCSDIFSLLFTRLTDKNVSILVIACWNNPHCINVLYGPTQDVTYHIWMSHKPSTACSSLIHALCTREKNTLVALFQVSVETRR